MLVNRKEVHIMEEQHPPVYSSIILKPYLARKRRLADGDTKIQNCITRITNRKRKVIWYDIKVNICVHIHIYMYIASIWSNRRTLSTGCTTRSAVSNIRKITFKDNLSTYIWADRLRNKIFFSENFRNSIAPMPDFFFLLFVLYRLSLIIHLFVLFSY